MARGKEIEYCNGRYKGSLDDEDCSVLETIIDLDSKDGCFSDLKHVIYNLPDSVVSDYIETMEKFGYVAQEPERPVGTLRDYQTLGVAFMFAARNCILGDSVGMGKTAQIAGLANMLRRIADEKNQPFRYLLLTEKNLIAQTRNEMVKFTGEFVHTLKGDAVACTKFATKYPCGEGFEHSVVGGHTLLKQSVFMEWLMSCINLSNFFPFDLLVVDESSILGNPKSEIAKNASVLFKFFKRIVFLNATPFETKLDVFYTQLDLLDKTMLPTRTNFQKEYVEMDYTGMFPRPSGKYKNAESFRKLVGYRYFARTRKSKGGKMEDCTGRVIASPLSEIQKEWLKKTQMPQMVYDCPHYFDSDIEFNEYNVPKLASLEEALDNDCEDADSILIFVRYRETQTALSDWLWMRGYSNRVLCGDTKQDERLEVIRGFKNKEFKVLVTNVQKGLNFGDCNHCIFFSYDPNPNKMVQFEGRITRSFDIIGKTVVVLCSEGKELDRLNKVVKKRANASAKFTQADLSCILDILLDDE